MSRSLKNYDAEKFSRILEEVTFPNYDIFSDLNTAYADFLKILSKAIESIAPLKETRIKNNSKDWFYRELHDKIDERNQLFHNFQITKLQIDEDLYKSSKNKIQKLVKSKKKTFKKLN